MDAKTILEYIRRVVFLSVPQWGTNIADWVQAHATGREAVVAELRAAVAGSQVPLLDRIEDWITVGAACLTGAGLLRAVQDSLREADASMGSPGPIRNAEAHEAASALELYLRQIASDFRAIDDLTSQRPGSGPTSPAHSNSDERRQELELWDDLHLEARSYATIGKRPFRFAKGRAAPPWELANPCTYPEIDKDPSLSEGTDIVYRAAYRACAGGPFELPCDRGKVTRRLPGAPKHPIERWGQRRHSQHRLHAVAHRGERAGCQRPHGHRGAISAAQSHLRIGTHLSGLRSAEVGLGL